MRLKQLKSKYFFLNLKSGQALKGGQVMMTTVVIFLFISIAIMSTAAVSAAKGAKVNTILLASKKSYFLAESGMDDAIFRIKNGKQISASETITTASGQVTTDISDISGGKQITSEGDTSSHIRRLQIDLSKATYGFEFFFGAQVGEGGLEMDQNSRIEGAGAAVGNIYSNGAITGENGATITGDATVATGLEEGGALMRSTTCNEDQIVGQVNPEIDFAQSFDATVSKPLSKISLYIKKVGNPSNRNIRIVADSAGEPDVTELSSGTLQTSLVGANYAWIDVVFSSPANLVSGQTYWIVLDARRDASKYWVWCRDKNNGFGNGIAKYSEDWDDDPWNAIVGDLTFKTYLGAGISSIDNIDILGTAKANTINDSDIGVDAYYQTISNTTVGGSSYPGSTDPPLLSMPISDANIASWVADAEAGGTISGDHSVAVDESLGPVKITGNLLFPVNNKTLTITGTVYVEGDIDIDNGSTIICDSAYGDNSCIVFSDGWIHISNNGQFAGSGDPNSYIMLLSTLDCDGSSSAPPCDDADHNGAIDIHNQADGAIIYANNGLINLHNGVNVTEVTAYKLRLDNTATVTYEQGLANADFSSGPGGSWELSDWEEVE